MLFRPMPTERAEALGELFDGHARLAAGVGLLDTTGDLGLESTLSADVGRVVVLHEAHERSEGDDRGLGLVVVSEDQRRDLAAAIEVQDSGEILAPELIGRDDIDGEPRKVGVGSSIVVGIAVVSHSFSLLILK
ncbi:hypothetical protein BU198_25210 [Streptomyces sp. CBMA156]|nr:hypothetical protein [Streptomyces sp. CBMA156]